jgi:hypothetical protein
MKKYTLSIALLALTAFFVFLAACGGDDPENLEGNGWLKIQVAIDDLVKENGPIVKCDESWTEHCPTYYDDPSSSSNNDGDGDDDTSSSSKTNNTSSDGGGGTSSADNTPIAAAGDNCKTLAPEEQKKIKDRFTCHWDPEEVEAGEDAKIIMNITSEGKAAGCEPGKASREIGTGLKKGLAYFPVNKPMKTSGVYDSIDQNGQKVDAYYKEWPKSSNDFIVNALLTCGGDGCANPCTALKIKKAGDPIVDGLAFSCPWTPIQSGTKNLDTDFNFTECSLAGTITNNDKVKCGSATLGATNIQYCGGTTPSACSGKKDTIQINAVVDCIGGRDTIETLKYYVVPAPTLTGKCAWDKTNSPALTPVKLIGGVTLENNYGRCASTTVSYKRTDGSTVALNTSLPEGVYNDVTPTIVCSGKTYEGAKCPDMQIQGVVSCTLPTGTYYVGDNVPAPALACAAEAGTIQTYGNVFGGSGLPDDQNQWNNGNAGSYKTPGLKTVTINEATCKKDGKDSAYKALNIPCIGTLNIKAASDLPGVSCSFGKTNYGIGEDFKPTLTCPDGYTVDNNGITYTGGADGQSQWGNNQNGNYKTPGPKTPVATFNCQKGNVKSSVTASCGTITIDKPTCVLPASNTYSTNQDVPAPKVYCHGTTEAATHSRVYAGDVPDNNNQWSNGNNGRYTSAGSKKVTLNQASCNNQQASSLGVVCTSDGTATGADSFVIK